MASALLSLLKWFPGRRCTRFQLSTARAAPLLRVPFALLAARCSWDAYLAKQRMDKLEKQRQRFANEEGADEYDEIDFYDGSNAFEEDKAK